MFSWIQNNLLFRRKDSFSNGPHQQVQVRHKKLSGLHFLSVIWSDKESAHTVCVCVSYSVNYLFGCFCKAALLRCRHNTVVEMTQNKGRWWSWVCCCCLSWGYSCASQRSYVNIYVKLLEAHPKQKYWQSTNTAVLIRSQSGGRSMVHNTCVSWAISITRCASLIKKLNSMMRIRTWLNCPFWFIS